MHVTVTEKIAERDHPVNKRLSKTGQTAASIIIPEWNVAQTFLTILQEYRYGVSCSSIGFLVCGVVNTVWAFGL